MKDTISVIVPVYNVADYLPACLDSLLAQTHQALEIILIDDGSTDHSGKICDEYAAKDSRIHVIHQKNGGAANAKNAGLRIATGEYLAFVDSDDWLEPDAYTYMLEQLDQNSADVIQCNFRNVYTDHSEDRITTSTLQKYTADEYLLRYTTDWTSGLLWDKLYRRVLFADIFFEEGHKIDDEFFTYRGIMNAKTLLLAPKIIYNYRQRQSSVTLNPNHGRQFIDDKLDYLPVRRQRIIARFPGLRRAFDLHFLNMLLLLARDPFATPESLEREKKLLKEYFREKGSTLPPRGLLPEIWKLWWLPTRKLLLKKEKPQPAHSTERYFK